MTRHRPEVRSRIGATDQGEAYLYRLTCRCSTQALSEHTAKSTAGRARQEHLAAVAAPAEQRCRQPREHGCRWWDACPLCAHQAVLPGLEVV